MKKKIAVLCGGPSNEHEVSLKSGEQVFAHLPRDRYEPTKIVIERDGVADFIRNIDQLRAFDVVFLALHGAFGEDGHVQALLDLLGVRYTGSGVLASALAMDKAKTGALLAGGGGEFRIPATLVRESSLLPDSALVSQIAFPCIIKPNQSGSSIGVSLVRSASEFQEKFASAARESSSVLVQQFVSGREFTCGVLGDRPLPPVEIISHREFFDFDAKYASGATEEICPAQIDAALTARIQDIALSVHRALNCRGLTRTDLILDTASDDLFFLEINTLPGLTEASLCPKEARAAGMSFADFLDQIVRLALV